MDDMIAASLPFLDKETVVGYLRPCVVNPWTGPCHALVRTGQRDVLWIGRLRYSTPPVPCDGYRRTEVGQENSN
jgi:hypothetical protein